MILPEVINLRDHRIPNIPPQNQQQNPLLYFAHSQAHFYQQELLKKDANAVLNRNGCQEAKNPTYLQAMVMVTWVLLKNITSDTGTADT